MKSPITLTKDAFQNNFHSLLSPSNQDKNISFNTKENENTEEDYNHSYKKTRQFENKLTTNDKNETKENLNSNNTRTSKSFLPKIYKKRKELITHTIIDYSINKSDFLSPEKFYYNNAITHKKNDSFPAETNENLNVNGSARKKLDIKNEKIKHLLEKSKKNGYYAPYFSLCKNCNERNNEFYNQINMKNAIGIINIINKADKKCYKLEKL